MKKTLLLLCALVCVSSLQAQMMVPKVAFGVTGGLAIPTGDFASTSSAEAGGATTGFGLGANVTIPVVPTLSVVGSFSFVSNGVSEELVKSLSGTSSYSGDVGSWTTLWPMAGLRYSTGVGPVVGIFLTAQGGLLLGTTPEVDVTSGGTRYRSKSFSSSAFAYGFGGGIMIADRFTVELRLLGGQPEYDFEFQASGSGFSSTFSGKTDQPTAIIQLNAGVTF
ncbi:MAG: outer membrane beta-barrel protein [Bacteroidota bacterium]